jgi:hypothetical protein
MTVILDANVLIAAVAAHGLCEAVVELCLAEHELVFSSELLVEVREKLVSKLKVPPARVAEFCEVLKQDGVKTEPAVVPQQACRDPKDMYLLGLATKSRAAFLVTGDKDLLTLTRFDQTRIVTPREFWERVRER